MLHYIKGKITMKIDSGVVVESGGIGYEVSIPDNSKLYLSDAESEVLVYTAMIVREDDVSLYGFAEKDSLDLFRKLMTVSGVGAKAALALLSAMSSDGLKKAILFDDAATLTKANGIGKKTAQRIVLELKDKLGMVSTGFAESADFAIIEGGRTEAVDGLIALGYSKSEAMEALAAVQEDDLTTEEYIKRALKKLF